MSRYILDTNHLSAYAYLQPNVMAKITAIGMSQIALTGITVVGLTAACGCRCR
jgi:predicted nucleic acid-binding protein